MKTNRPVIEISHEVCVGCGLCANVCPTGAISVTFGKAGVNPHACTGCGHCLEVCRPGAIRWRDEGARRKIPERPFPRRRRPERGRFLPRQRVFRELSRGDSDLNELRRRLQDLKGKADNIVKRIERL